jgi:hypothetical protein
VAKPKITTLANRVAYQNRWMKPRKDSIAWRDGSRGLHCVVGLLSIKQLWRV